MCLTIWISGAFEGHFGCMGALAHCLFFGVGGVEKVNTSQAFQLWKQAALQGGDPEALRSLARCKYTNEIPPYVL
eukprot:1140252-Amorphochlora_amoeboformis.AAC.1